MGHQSTHQERDLDFLEFLAEIQDLETLDEEAAYSPSGNVPLVSTISSPRL